MQPFHQSRDGTTLLEVIICHGYLCHRAGGDHGRR
jgi:hypothetical protein